MDISFARPPGQRLVDLRFEFAVAYLSVPPASPAKNITKAQCDDYLNYIFLLLVWEMTAGRPNLGAAAGAQDGANAARLALALGQPADVAILVACDTNTTPANVANQEAYMRAFAAACKPYPIGIYGDVDILYRCFDLWVIGWLPNAWSWSGGSRAIAEATARALGVHVLQHTGYYIDGTWAVDPDEVIADFQAWGLGSDPTQEDDMPKFVGNSAGTVAMAMLDGSRRELSVVEYEKIYGFPVPQILSDADWASMPIYTAAPAPPPPVIDTDAIASAVVAKMPPPRPFPVYRPDA